MDELELLKKDWQKHNTAYPKLSYNDIYRMIHKKSSSIVKWIFIIGILEFLLWTGLSFAMDGSEAMIKIESYDVDYILITLSVISYGILVYFLYRFFMNYKRISVTDNAKSLMEKILKTRQTVKQYVVFNLVFLFISTFIVVGIHMNNDTKLIKIADQAAASGELFLFYGKLIFTTILVLAVFIAVLLLFYFLIYGLLLKRLKRNYKELKNLKI